MTKYRVPIIMTFNGAVEVEAEDESQAEEIVCGQVCASLGDVYSHGHPSILNWSVDRMGYAERCDKESIEEVEDNEDESKTVN